MSNKVVIYKSKYGGTKIYAQWIANRLKAELYEVNEIDPKTLEKYETIIYGGGLYVGNINGIKFITKNYEDIKDKNIIVFSVGMQSIDNEFNKKILENNFTCDMVGNIKLFNFRGGIDYSKLKFIDKILIQGMRASLSMKSYEEFTDDDKLIIESFERAIDLSNEKTIDVLIESIEN